MSSKNSIHQSSDKLFKLSMADPEMAKSFFREHLPKNLLQKIDLNNLRLQKQTFIDEAYKSTEADVVYSAQIDKLPVYLYLLCEQQTKVDLNLAFRLLVYIVRIMEEHRKQHPKQPLPLVYPMVVYTGDEPWTAPLDIFPLFGEAEDIARQIFLKPYQLLDVNRIDDDELRRQELFGLVAFVLKYRKTIDFKRFLKRLLPWLHEIEEHFPSSISLGGIVLKYIIDRSPQGDLELLVQEAQDYLSEELTGEIMTIAQQLEKKGFEKGMIIAQQWKNEGVQEGLQQGEAALLKRLLQRRFGELPFIYTQQIASANTETLLEWGEKVLDAKTLEEIFA
jgi:predicted transposase/invertase (TIGR01784 family)